MGALSSSSKVWIISIIDTPLEVRNIISAHCRKLNDNGRLCYRRRPCSILLLAKFCSRSISAAH